MNLKVANDKAAIHLYSFYEEGGLTLFFADEHRCETKLFPDPDKCVDFLIELFKTEYDRFGYATSLIQCICDLSKHLKHERLIDAILDEEAGQTL